MSGPPTGDLIAPSQSRKLDERVLNARLIIKTAQQWFSH